MQYVQPQILKTSNQGLGLFDEPDNPYTPNPCSNLSIIRPPLLLMHQMIPTVGGHLYMYVRMHASTPWNQPIP